MKLPDSERTELLARVIALAELMWDDSAAARTLSNTPHAELDGRTPIESATTELGARRVEDVVMRAYTAVAGIRRE